MHHYAYKCDIPVMPQCWKTAYQFDSIDWRLSGLKQDKEHLEKGNTRCFTWSRPLNKRQQQFNGNSYKLAHKKENNKKVIEMKKRTSATIVSKVGTTSF